MKSRYINYIISKMFQGKMSFQTAIFDTMTQTSTYASDLFFKKEDLKHW